MQRILFIAKKGQQYSGKGYVSSGLLNSAKLVVDMLRENGVDARFVQVVDNNDIDREVTQNHPDIVVIEALWVVPEKFDILYRLHPSVQWVIRIHSEIPFLAQEGIAVKWLFEYLQHQKVSIAFNSKDTLRDFRKLLDPERLLYLPNYFPLVSYERHSGKMDLHVGCFGAIRPLKNQLIQAMAAIQYTDLLGETLYFHMNARVEGGQEVIKNLRSLFDNTRHTLVEHEWMSHRQFQHVLSLMDISMCVSLSETFCLVAADSVSVGVPLVCSAEVPWASRLSVAETTDIRSIVDTMVRVTRFKGLTEYLNRRGLYSYNRRSKKIWLEFIKEEYGN